jgi:hypothetical protein
MDGILWESRVTEVAHIVKEIRLEICNNKGTTVTTHKGFLHPHSTQCPGIIWLSGATIPTNTKQSHSVNYVVRPEHNRESLAGASAKSQSDPWLVHICEKDTTFLEQDRNEAFARVFEDFLDGLEKAYVVRVQ